MSIPSHGWEPVIGLEVHVQLATEQKLFCADSTAFGREPNTNVCPVCLGLPGALPVTNRGAVALGVRAALGLDCTIHETSIFARKNYFYPDLPKGYQISQFEAPLATGGRLVVDAPEEETPVAEDEGSSLGDDETAAGHSGLDVDGAGTFSVRIRRLHLEEDAGKSLHDRLPSATAVDLNRTGVPLAEIVSEPDLRSPAQARAYLVALKLLLEYLEVSDCNMEEGSLRVDANVSLRPVGSDTLGTKTELKNLNSFSGVEKGLALEIERQRQLLDSGGEVHQQTMLYDERRVEVRPMRSKEESHDYRYFPDPDLPPLKVSSEWVEEIRADLPERPRPRRHRFEEEYELPTYDAGVLTADRATADYYEAVVSHAPDPKTASNWVMGSVLRAVKEQELDMGDFPVPPDALGELMGLVDEETISQNTGKDVFRRMLDSGRGAREIVESEGLAQVKDEGQLAGWVDEVVAENPEEAQRYRDGEERLLGFFMGQVMQKSRGKAEPGAVNELLRERLS